MAYFRKKGTGWQYTVSVGIDPRTGERKQKSKGGFNTKKEAQSAAAEFEKELKMIGTYSAERREVTFELFAKEWLEAYEKSGKVKISSVRVRKHEVNNLMPYFAKLKVAAISSKRYQDAITSLHARLSENTLSGVHSTGRMIFKRARELDIIQKDPTEFAYVPKTIKTIEQLENESEKKKYLEKEELASFLDESKKNHYAQDYIIFLLLSYTGMRVGELCALKWSDIDLQNSSISITKTYYNPSNNTTMYQLLTPKTKTSKRIIEIDKLVVNELEKHKMQQLQFKMRNRKVYEDLGFVITNLGRYAGYPITLNKVSLRMNSILKNANLDAHLTPHSLRHTHTSLLAEAGVGLQEIMDRLGHKDDNTTRDVYWHVTRVRKKEASQKFAELMRSL